MFLAIHIGVLMDRFGTRKVTLFFVWTGMALAPVFPLVPWFWPLLPLQLINGAAVSFAWSGAQTLIAQLADGDARISAGSLSSLGSARPRRRSSPVPSGISAALGRPTSLAPHGAAC
jgi:MFS family permease